LAAGTHFAVQQGIMRPNPNYGARPKVILGVIVGYFLGKFSYADACADKFLVQVDTSFPSFLIPLAIHYFVRLLTRILLRL